MTKRTGSETFLFDSAMVPLVVGYVALFVLLAGFGFWSVSARISGAVIADGVVKVDGNQQVVQHPNGGVVEAIFAQDGDYVEKGQTLVRLEDAILRMSMRAVELQLNEIQAQSVRLQAESEGLTDLVFPEELTSFAAKNQEAARQLRGQLRQFEFRKIAQVQETDVLGAQVLQMKAAINGAELQIEALNRQERLVRGALSQQRELLKKGLTGTQRAMELEGELAMIQAKIGELESRIKGFKFQISAVKLEIQKLPTERAVLATSQLWNLKYMEIELRSRKATLAKKLADLDIKAPVSGVVHRSEVFAVQSVVQPGVPLMYIIPRDRRLVVAARVDPASIDQVLIGQAVDLRFTAIDWRRSPLVKGRVAKVSADAIVDKRSGMRYFGVEIMPDGKGVDALGGGDLLPGMPVEVFFRTGERTLLEYLAKPLTDYFARAFRG